MVQTQWQQTLRRLYVIRKNAPERPIFPISGDEVDEAGFPQIQLWLSAEAPWPKLSVYSGGCWRTPTPMILAFMRKKSMGEQGTRKQCLELYLCFVSAQLMNCRGRGGTDFYRFLCLRLVRSGTVADRATPRAPAPEGRLYEAAFTSSNRR